MYEILYDKNIPNDLMLLSDEVLAEALEYFQKLQNDYFKYSKPLYNMQGRNLQDCRKTYFGDAEFRIVSKLEENTIKIINIIAVGKRENLHVYNIAHERINN